MFVQTTRFGPMTFSEEDVITFPEGLLGFEEAKRFLLVDVPAFAPLRWLQSVERPALAFVLCDPLLFLPDYRVRAHKNDLAVIGLEDESQGYVYVILVVGEDYRASSANLKGPLVFNLAKRLAKQLVLADADYSVRHPLFAEADSPVAAAG